MIDNMRFVALLCGILSSSAASSSEWVHNGSTVELIANGTARTFVYKVPRPGLPVSPGTVLFDGTRRGDEYSGRAFIFHKGCEPFPYLATGGVSADGQTVRMTGDAPRLDAMCRVVKSVPDELVFTLVPPISVLRSRGAE